MREIPSIKITRYSEPDKRGRVHPIGRATVGEVFDQLQEHLKTVGLLPDEYFLLDWNFNREEAMPKDFQVYCTPAFGISDRWADGFLYGK